MLSVDEQPASVKMYGHDILVQYMMLEMKSATITTRDSFLKDVLELYNNTTLCLLFLEGLTRSGNRFYLFDLRSLDERGLSVADGTSVLIKFE